MALPNPLKDLFGRPPTPGVLGVFQHLDATVAAIRQLKAGGHRDLTVYSPIPRHELDTDATYSSRDVCSRACMRVVKGTQAERGRMRLERETGP